MAHEIFDGWQHPLFAALKALALFITAAAAFRFAERRTIAEFSPFDWVTAVAVGAIVGRVATSTDTSYLTGAAALVTLLAAHGAVSRLRFIPWFRRLVDPPVRVLIRRGEVQRGNVKRAGITPADLDAILRRHGYTSPSEVGLALYESKGSVSVFSEDVETD
ncbi:putative membrane protein [Mycolicibacterium chubuense NBB4]|uniref:Putative membrane protein n=1 Tax=Mycolicibacterium chubuense (strain NBB4) TaxID=710421 RepID=I4BE09_MYCCN|nr:YetF domain-containing protein [Mycolicibacterium chubuense]AFM15516.1 putative membrane protein [Mycolicibacterium chubuense NBB4]